jgi:flavin reductase (DIM6/NTAB) family NADH-FMN oxidoreductase RutF
MPGNGSAPTVRTVDPVRVRAAFRRHPEGVTIITTLDEFGYQWGMTATAVTAVSLDPPLLLVCVANRSGLIGPMTAGAGFMVNFLAAQQKELASRFATPLEDKFADTSYQFAPSGCARLNGALASVECVAHDVHPAGDHTIVVGQILDVTLNESVDDALVFFDGTMSSI